MKRSWPHPFGLALVTCVVSPLAHTAGQGIDTPPKPHDEPQRAVAPVPSNTVLSFRKESKKFVLKNNGKTPVWYYAYSQNFPWKKVERLTKDGWVTTRYDGVCGTGAHRYRLDPGKSVEFACGLGTSAEYGEVLGYRTKYPGLDHLPARVHVDVDVLLTEKSGNCEEIYSETFDEPSG